MTDRECKVNPVSSRVCEKGTKSCTIYHQDRELLCKEFTELTGGHWHEDGEFKAVSGKIEVEGKMYKTEYQIRNINPTYTNPADVLRVMALRNDYDAFTRGFLQREQWLLIEEFIEKYILEPDSLLKAAVGFLKEGKK
jgi:hypothetical protein